MSTKYDASKVLSDNRPAGHNFFLFDRYEAGIALTGTEVKAAKAGKVQLRDAYGSVEKGEAWLLNAHISEYSHGNRFNHSPTRPRKLLLHRRQLDDLMAKVQESGYSLIPLELYFKDGFAKIELALARGKKLYDKRETEKKRTWQRERGRLMREKG